MSLGTEVAAALPGLRAQAESRMSETVEFFTVSDGFDPVSLQPVPVESVVASGVRARLRASDRADRDVTTGAQVPVVTDLVLSVPVGSVSVGPSVMVRVTGSLSDAALVGVVVRTVGFPTLGQVTAWRYPVERVS